MTGITSVENKYSNGGQYKAIPLPKLPTVHSNRSIDRIKTKMQREAGVKYSSFNVGVR